MTLAESREREMDLGVWIEKWDYILRNDPEQARQTARLALIQLEKLVHSEFHKK